MWRLMKVFFGIVFLCGLTSLIFLVFYSVRHRNNSFKKSVSPSKLIQFINSTPRPSRVDQLKKVNTKTTVHGIISKIPPATKRSVAEPTQKPTMMLLSTSKNTATEAGDLVDKLIDKTLENSQKRSHAEGDESDPTEGLENGDGDSQVTPTEQESKDNKGNSPGEADQKENSDDKPSSAPGESDEDLETCPVKPPSLTGPLYVNQNVPKMEELEKHLSEEYGGWVQKGGAWKPSHCKARVKVALIVPFRKRHEQLAIFVRHMHPMLKRQELDYRIIIVEQSGSTPFNRAILFNIGYKEALKFQKFNCFIFHDVDLIPEDDRNMYSCPTSPRHMSVAVDKFNYRLPYAAIFGGAGSFIKEHFDEINGFSNKFWGWGGEDDDLYQRVVAKGHHLTRPSLQIGRYKMVRIHHHQSSKADPNRHELLRNTEERMQNDGLNSLKYKLLKVKEELLYTMVTIHVDRSMTR